LPGGIIELSLLAFLILLVGNFERFTPGFQTTAISTVAIAPITGRTDKDLSIATTTMV
jgi:hypothetical protein